MSIADLYSGKKVRLEFLHPFERWRRAVRRPHPRAASLKGNEPITFVWTERHGREPLEPRRGIELP